MFQYIRNAGIGVREYIRVFKKFCSGKFEKIIVCSLCIHKTCNTSNNNICNITSHFVAPWARGHGLAKTMIDKAETVGIENGVNCVQLDVRETQDAAIQLFKSKGYKQWGTNPNYSQVNGKNIKGFYYFKHPGKTLCYFLIRKSRTADFCYIYYFQKIKFGLAGIF